MQNPPEPTCLVIADIAGYTSYLSGVELDHAQDILADLMATVVSALRPSFRLAKLEGDAAFAYVVAAEVDGSALQDTVEGTYLAFRRRLRDIAQATRCECNACLLMPRLDLKLVVHHGVVARHRIAGREELVGAPVIVIHRLLKNEVEAAAGLKAYALYTQDCVAAAKIDPEAQGLRRHVETTDVAGELVVWLRDLEAVWEADDSGRRFHVGAKDAVRTFELEHRAPPALVWEYLTSPTLRPQWSTGVTAIHETAPTGRRGVGTVNHCMHGQDATIEEVLDWRPGESLTTRSRMPIPGVPPLVLTWDLEPSSAGGTHLSARVGRPRPKDRSAFDQLAPMLEGMMQASGSGLLAALDEAMAFRAHAGEPEVPVGAGRYASQPVDSGTSGSSSR